MKRKKSFVAILLLFILSLTACQSSSIKKKIVGTWLGSDIELTFYEYDNHFIMIRNGIFWLSSKDTIEGEYFIHGVDIEAQRKDTSIYYPIHLEGDILRLKNGSELRKISDRPFFY